MWHIFSWFYILWEIEFVLQNHNIQYIIYYVYVSNSWIYPLHVCVLGKCPYIMFLIFNFITILLNRTKISWISNIKIIIIMIMIKIYKNSYHYDLTYLRLYLVVVLVWLVSVPDFWGDVGDLCVCVCVWGGIHGVIQKLKGMGSVAPFIYVPPHEL